MNNDKALPSLNGSVSAKGGTAPKIPSSSSSSNSTTSWITKALPAFHCILIAIAFSLASFRFFILDSSDRYKCNAMLNDGQWLDEGLSAPHSLNNWQPDGCMFTNYNKPTAVSCLKGRTIIFVGDSIVRRIYYKAVHLFDPEFDTSKLLKELKHADFSVVASGVHMEFSWDPYLNSSRTRDILARKDHSQKDGQLPAVVVFGTGLWELNMLGDKAEEVYISAIDRLITATNPETTKKLNGKAVADEVILIPVEHTLKEKIKGPKALKMTNPKIDNLNSVLRSKIPPYKQSTISDLSVIYAINRLIETPDIDRFTEDGVHYGGPITDTHLNLILNLRCNDVLPKKFPFDKTCCMQYPAPNWMQTIIILFALIWAPLGTHYYSSNGRPFYSRFFPPQHVLVPMTIFGFSCVFMYFADRTSLYLKVQKQFDFWQFTIAMIAALALGLGTLKKPEKDLGFLNRDQTDEWKGWMQIAILIYHYYLASRISGIYNPIRVLVAAYLFMTGYGHFFFYYKKADFGLARVAGVLVRLNLLTIALAYIQDTDYLSYYFSPLVTVWFGVIWVTMYIGYNHNKKLPFMLAKIGLSAAITAAFHLYEAPLSMLFGIFNAVFHTAWNSKEWSFRVTLDMYIVYVGMLAALFFIKVQELKIWEKQWWPRARTLSYLASLIGLAGYFAFELRYTKFEYNHYHPYVSWVPVLSFVVLRNATPLLRSTSSRAFIWIGQCSLETFICQFHLWLAGDTKGLLVLLPWPRLRFLNMVFTTLVFLFVSNQIATSTGHLTDWICGKVPKNAATTSAAIALPSGGGSSSAGGAQYVPLSTMNGDEVGSSTTVDGMPEIKHVPTTMEKLLASLPFRCAVTMGLIWLINLLYPTSHPPQGHLLPTH